MPLLPTPRRRGVLMFAVVSLLALPGSVVLLVGPDAFGGAALLWLAIWGLIALVAAADAVLGGG
jgi:hypothetical protein